MTKNLLIATAMAASLALSAASAQSITAGAPETLIATLNDMGYSADLHTDCQGDPQIRSSIGGVNFDVNFYGCNEDGAACRDIQLRATFNTEGRISMAQMHDWNRDYYIGKAYLNNSGHATIEHAVAGVDGMSRYTFERMMARWESALDRFRAQIGW